MPRFVINNEFIPVSVYFIENFLKEANGAFVKVYLYGLHLAVRNTEIDTASIATELDMLESDVLQAFVYWKNKGLIVEEDGVIEFCQQPPENIFAQPVPQPADNEKDNNARKSYNSIEIANNISQNESLSDLVLLAQEFLAKPLTQQELETIYWFYDELGFSTEAILMIIEYCVSREKRNMRYIEKVAISWHEKGIRTAEQIMDYINEDERKHTMVYKIQKNFGIADRTLSNAEEKYIKKWLENYKMSEDMIMLAYEYCLLNTSKLSMPYMDKILEKWHQNGIFTRDAAEAEHKNYKQKSTVGFNPYVDEFNHEELEKLTRKE